MNLTAALSRITEDLTAVAPGHCLVGGLAVSVRVEPRFTRDLDFAVAVDDDRHAEALILALHGRGYTTYAVIQQARTGRLATVRLRSPDVVGQVPVDLLFASSGIEPEVCASADRVEVLPRLVIPVAQAGHLVALKLLSVDDDRPRDAQDLAGLRAVVTDDDVALAREAVALIASRQAHRGRDLDLALQRWFASSRSR